MTIIYSLNSLVNGTPLTKYFVWNEI